MPPPSTSTAGPRRGLVVAVVLVGLTMVVPPLTGWSVRATSHFPHTVAPLHATWAPALGIGTPFAILIGVLAIGYGERLAAGLSWRRLLLTAYVASLAWAISLAFVHGPSGLSREMESPAEYLRTARQVHDVPALLQDFVARIPLGAPDNWPIHVAGHPPGALLLFVALVRLGIGSGFAVGVVVTVIGTTTPVAALVTLRLLGAESAARRAAPYLVITPAALWIAVSADGLFAAVAAWGLAALAGGCTTARPGARWSLAVLAGLLLGSLPVLSYGLVLFAPLVIAVLVLTRGWRLLPVVAVAALVPMLLLAGNGFYLWEAYPVLRRRYWDGLAHSRPTLYWLFGDLACLVLSAGPALGASLGSLVGARHDAERVIRYLAGAAAACVVLADASLMSKAEVERIWLPFVPWLLVSTALLPPRWRRPMLVVQVVTALVIEHLTDTYW